MRIGLMLMLLPGLLAGQNVTCTTPQGCWQELEKGNQRWTPDPVRLTHPNQSAARRKYVTENKQKPFAVIVACSDSRVAPEVVFDRGMGDLFVVRTAGNIVDDLTLGAIQYALQVVETKLVVVMGHEKCGAIEAAMEPSQKLVPPLRTLVEALVPAKQWAIDQWHHPISQDDVADANVYMNIETIIKRLPGGIATPANVIGKRYMLDGRVVSLRPKNKS